MECFDKAVLLSIWVIAGQRAATTLTVVCWIGVPNLNARDRQGQKGTL